MTIAMPSQSLPTLSTPDAMLTALEQMFRLPEDAEKTFHFIQDSGTDAIHTAMPLPIRPEFDCE
jgi:hypothetical protein